MIETSNCLGHSFKKLHFLMEQLMNRKLQELELTSAQGHVIGFLRRSKEPPCARDLETVYGLSHATVSGILSRMEGKGFIEQRPDPKDRRIKRIYLLEKGTACSESIWRHIEESEGIMAEGFTAGELEQFRTYLRRAISNLEQSSGKTTVTERSKQ
ncbi:MAG: winged helix-turn-helix transcriptional regulator [Oscillospiraceae bacterium]|nr:winged helix-turn-helix transcriptional regulator [Oscillospiraceae bacterium]